MLPNRESLPMTYELKDEEYLKLWIYFQDRADNIKEAMFKTLTWTIGFAAALLAFIFANLIDFDPSRAIVTLWSIVSITAAAGLVICLYSWFMLSESGKHIQYNWDRANRCELHVKDLGIIIRGDGAKKQGDGAKKRNVMKIWDQLRIIVVLFAIAFAGVLLWMITAT